MVVKSISLGLYGIFLHSKSIVIMNKGAKSEDSLDLSNFRYFFLYVLLDLQKYLLLFMMIFLTNRQPREFGVPL